MAEFEATLSRLIQRGLPLAVENYLTNARDLLYEPVDDFHIGVQRELAALGKVTSRAIPQEGLMFELLSFIEDECSFMLEHGSMKCGISMPEDVCRGQRGVEELIWAAVYAFCYIELYIK